MPDDTDSTSNAEAIPIAADDTIVDDAGSPDNTGKSVSKVPLPEEFQLQVQDMVNGATRPQLDFIQSLCSTRSAELYNEENKEPDMDDFEKVKSEPE